MTSTLRVVRERTETQAITIPVEVFALYFTKMQPSDEAIQAALAQMKADEPFDADVVRWTFDAALMVVEAIVEAVANGAESRCDIAPSTVEMSLMDGAGWSMLRSDRVLEWLHMWRQETK